MSRPLTLVILMTFSLNLAAAGQAEPPRFDFRTRTLDNGLRVVTMEDFSCPVAAVQVWYHVGSADENPHRQGFAHMFEHMMFRGTDRLGPKDHFEWIRRSGGDCNGYTSFDQTVYVNRVPANQLPLALWLEAERMALLKIDRESYVTERSVVEEERRLGLNRPYGTVFEKLLPAVFAEHPYRWTPIGQIPHLRAARVAEVRAFWERFYVPNNAVLVIVGAVKHDDAARLAEQYFGWIPRRDNPPTLPPRACPPGRPQTLTLPEPRGPVPMVGLAWPSVAIADADRLPLQFAAQTLGEGRSSRLYVELVEQRKAAVDVDASAMAWQRAGVFFVRATLSPKADPADALDRLTRQVQRLRDEPISNDEWTKARNQLLRGEVTGSMTISSKASMLGRFAVTYGDLNRANRRLEEIAAVTREDVQRAAARYLDPAQATRLVVQPTPGAAGESDDVPADATDDDTASAPRTARPADFPKDPPVQPLLDAMPKIAHHDKTLANGLRVVVVHDPRLPFVRMTLGLDFGAWSEKAVGSAALACRMLTRGSANYTAEQLAGELELHAISLEGHAGLDVAEVHADCLSEHLDRTAKLLAEVVLRPTFPPEQFELLREQTLSNLLIKANTPDYIADRQFRMRLFGPHPYSRTPVGKPDNVRQLTCGDLSSWWTTFARPDAAVLYLAGDVTPEVGFALAEKWLGQWKADGPRPDVALPAVPPMARTHIYLVDRPGLVQSEIRAGHVGITRNHADYFTSRVLTQIFGGAFNSRLMQSLRIEKGLTYNAGGSFAPERFSGVFRVRTFTKMGRTAEAVEAILEQLDKLQHAPPTAEELDIARSYLVGSFAGSHETPQSLVNDLWLIEYADLPDDYLARYVAGIRNTKAADVTRVAGELVHPDQVTIVVVGDAGQIKTQLEKIAPVTVVAQEPEKAGTSSK